MPENRSAAALHTFALVAALRTALGVSRGIAARRGGHDPSEDEPAAAARADLLAALERMGGLLVRLRLRTVTPAPEDDHAALVQEFEDRLVVADLAEELRVAHQKLLSLYPAVEEECVESIRQRHREGLDLAEVDDVAAVLVPFTEGLADELAALRLALVERT